MVGAARQGVGTGNGMLGDPPSLIKSSVSRRDCTIMPQDL